MTVFKNTVLEAGDASALAIALLNGETPAVESSIDINGVTVPAKYSDPVIIYAANVSDVIAATDGFDVAALCAGDVAAACTELGIQ
jgi:ABC-type xylose transport system substrate-binding protein